MPLVVLEAMAAHRPAVVTDISGSQDLVRDGENGFVVEAGDVEAMTDRLSRLLSDSDLRTRQSMSTAEIIQDYSWDRVSRRYLELARGH